MYSLYNKFDNTLDVLNYTLVAMKESSYSHSEIDDYIENAISSNNYHLVDVSLDCINECNRLLRPSSNFNYINNKYYFDTVDEDIKFNEDDYFCEDFVNYGDSQYYLGCEDTDDCYEGFSSCNNHIWSYFDSIDEEEDAEEL